MFRPVTVVAKITKNEEMDYYLNFQITFAAVLFGVWRSWLAHQHGVLGAGGSSPLTPTKILQVGYFVYILKSKKDFKYYVGSTNDVTRRLEYRNSGRQRSTEYRIPFELVYTEELPDKEIALKREFQIKT